MSDHGRIRGTRAARQKISPVFRTVEIAHVLVMRIEHDPIAGPDLVGGEAEEHTACPGIAANDANNQPIGGLEDGPRKIVDGV